MKTLKRLICLILLSTIYVCIASSQVVVDFENGYVFTGSNDVRIPGDQGTLFSLSDELSADPVYFYRLRASYTINNRHTLSLLYAPLEVISEGMVSKNVVFEGRTFTPETQLKANYQFNSYRLTYRYEIINKSRLQLGLGLTAKIREARIALASSNQSQEKTNVGFVPIINFRLLVKLNDNIGFLLDGDALAAKQGRAEDVLAAMILDVNKNIRFKLGYRILEGGADNAEVYNFSLFNYASVGLSLSF